VGNLTPNQTEAFFRWSLVDLVGDVERVLYAGSGMKTVM